MFIESVSHNSGWSNSCGRMDVVFYGNGKLNPGKPELNIDPPAAERMKICGIALRGVGVTTPTSRRLRPVFSI